MRTTSLWVLAFSYLTLLMQPGATAQSTPPPLVGIDHIPLAVRSLEQAAETYRRMGFALKPGRPHENSIRNAHVKFPDGSGIELITASRREDALSTHYVDLLIQGEGPASFALHARDTNRLLSALDAAGLGYSQQSGLIKLSDPHFDFLFFVRDNRSSTDRPEHFAHPNTAAAMTAVWLATSDVDRVTRLMTALGAVASHETLFVPQPTSATVFAVENGKIVLLPQAHQLIEGRPIVGAAFRVTNLGAVRTALAAAKVSPVALPEAAKSPQLFIPPEAAHGIWLQFAEQ